MILYSLLIGSQIRELFVEQPLRISWESATPSFVPVFLGLACLLMPVNWLLETWKWQLLHRAFYPWTFHQTFRAVLAGVAAGIVTPNRLGEHGARVLVGPPPQALHILYSSVLAAVCQWAAFLLLGWPALLYTAFSYFDWSTEAWLPLSGFPLLLFLGLYFIKLPVSWLPRSWRLWTYRIIRMSRRVKFRLIYQACGIACLRFSVYCLQLYCLIIGFGLSLPLISGLSGAAAIFLVQAGIPLPPGLGMLTRTEFSLLLWGASLKASAALLLASTSLFIINLAIPATLGTVYLLMYQKRTSECS